MICIMGNQNLTIERLWLMSEVVIFTTYRFTAAIPGKRCRFACCNNDSRYPNKLVKRNNI